MPKYHFWVYLAVETQTLSLAELSQRLGIEPSAGSIDKGAASGKRSRISDRTIWKLSSVCADTQPLGAHFQSIFDQLPLEILRNTTLMPADLGISFQVGIGFNVEEIVAPSVVLEAEWIEKLTGIGVDVEFTFYPCQDKTPPSEPGAESASTPSRSDT